MGSKKLIRPFAQDFSGPSRTDQSFKNTCDVNRIIERYIQTGLDPAPGRAEQTFGFASSKTYEEVTREIAEVNSAFASLPSAERASHSNDPAAWLDSLAAPEPQTEAELPPIAAETLSEAPQDPTPIGDT